MNIFKDENLNKIYQGYQELLKEIIFGLQEPAESLAIDISKLQKIECTFKQKVDDFFRSKRKLRIAVIGQVKAGKSSFLNTMLFNGEKVLPTAATPKTATLTVIKFGERNRIEIEFYSHEEWKELVRLSELESDIIEVEVAKEIMKMMGEGRTDVEQHIGQEPLVIEFGSHSELLGRLNDYTGENGMFTPIVKSLTMYVNDEKIKEVEIIDTPGMNDPILSRTDKTRQCIEFCDVVFFLSQASAFLDKTDMELLARQLPQKGIGRMVLIASKYDSAILDVIWQKDSLNEAEIDIKVRLKNLANKNIESYLQELDTRNHGCIIKPIIQGCLPPMFISSMSHNMSQKCRSNYSDEEENIFKGLCEYEELSLNELKRIGNFEAVRNVFESVVAEKETKLILENKKIRLIPVSGTEVLLLLNSIYERCGKRINLLQKENIDQLKNQQKIINSKKQHIAVDLETIFGGLNLQIENNRNEVLDSIRTSVREFSELAERTGTEVKYINEKISKSKWYNPFSWGSYDTKHQSYSISYTYLDVSDAIENLRNYTNEAANSIESLFNNAIDQGSIKKELLKTIIDNFNTEEESFDPSYFRLIVEQTINQLEIPFIHIDISEEMQSLAAICSGEVRNSCQKAELRIKYSAALAAVFESIQQVLLSEISKVKNQISNLKKNLGENLITDINKELETIIKQFENKQNELDKSEALRALVNKYKNVLQNYLENI